MSKDTPFGDQLDDQHAVGTHFFVSRTDLHIDFLTRTERWHDKKSNFFWMGRRNCGMVRYLESVLNRQF